MMAAMIRKRAEAMMAYKAENGPRPYVVRALGRLTMLSIAAAAGSIMLSAAAAPVRLVGVSRNDVERRGAVAGVRLEQASAVDGASIARVRFSLARAADYKVRSARNMIR